jgi:hypothetical protein
MRVVPIIYPKENKHTGAQTLHPLFKQFNKGRRGQTVIRREECDPWASPVDCEERYGVEKKRERRWMAGPFAPYCVESSGLKPEPQIYA